MLFDYLFLACNLIILLVFLISPISFLFFRIIFHKIHLDYIKYSYILTLWSLPLLVLLYFIKNYFSDYFLNYDKENLFFIISLGIFSIYLIFVLNYIQKVLNFKVNKILFSFFYICLLMSQLSLCYLMSF